MANQFTWIPLYQELARELAKWQDRQGELIAFLERLREQQYVITPLMDKDENGSRFLLKEIDPFTFYGVFNRGIKKEQRIAILDQIKHFFNLQSSLPDDFNGIPVLFNMTSWFIAFHEERMPGDTGLLWKVFQLSLKDSPLKNQEFLQTLDDALKIRGVNVNLTMGLFWIRPDAFLNLDNVNREYLGLTLPAGGLTSKYYVEAVHAILAKGKSFPEISLEAWQVGDKRKRKQQDEVNYWLVGAYWDNRNPTDQTKRFLNEGIWENGYNDRYLDEVKSMSVNDRIAIKASTTQKKDLPFNGSNHTVSCNIIKAIGTIVANRNDGKIVEVEWEPNFKEKNWYFYTNRGTVWHVGLAAKKVWKEAADQLINFVWYGQKQDYDWFIKQWWGTNTTKPIKENDELPEGSIIPFSIEDILTSGVFLERNEINQIIDRLSEKKAMIIQGAPGVGKTFLAKKLGYALMEEVAPERLVMVQFHQSYSYDDFVRGYRPVQGSAGNFGLQNGVFYEFCQKAANDPEHKYVFIIDEINRGNLSQIFGELLMLIEHDKRGPDFSVPLVYRNQQDEPRFYVPSNLYLIGLMNLADRSLAMVDYALRRRFVFANLEPKYESDLFRRWLLDRSMSLDLVNLIVERLTALNKEIKEDPLLGENYQIGHSFFCPKGEDFETLDKNWYQGIVLTEIVPLLKEYWFDNQMRAEEAKRRLLA